MRRRIDLPVWVHIHHGDPGRHGTDHRIAVAPVIARETYGRQDPYGITDLSILAVFRRVTVTNVTHFSLWGGEDGRRLLAVAGFPHAVSTRDGDLTIDSRQPGDR